MTRPNEEKQRAHTDALRKAAAKYRRAKEKADQIMAEPRRELAEAMRAAYADNMRKSDILRAADHVWSRQWVDQTLKPEATDGPADE